jgi:multidrug efflux pump subunit AcrB
VIAASDTVRPEAKGANARVAFISLTAIPLSLLEAIIVLTRVGISINTLTLGGLAIAIGEVVDDAIIDAEKIFRRLREEGRIYALATSSGSFMMLPLKCAARSCMRRLLWRWCSCRF